MQPDGKAASGFTALWLNEIELFSSVYSVTTEHLKYTTSTFFIGA